MTRQKKEVIRKIAELDRQVALKEALALGHAPDVTALIEAIDRLQEELARLSHFDTYIEYVMDERWRRGRA